MVADWEIREGDVLARLREIPDSSVQCCITSPPYWGLRDYDLPPSIWGGDPACEHTFTDQAHASGTTYGGKTRWQHVENGRGEYHDELADHDGRLRSSVARGALCVDCGAWRGCLGLEPTPELWVEHLVAVFAEVRRALRDDGTLWLNLGDSYAGSWGAQGGPSPDSKSATQIAASPKRTRTGSIPSGASYKAKDLIGAPWMVAFALRADGWFLRSDIIWHKLNPMPESVTDRPTSSHEHLFLLSKKPRYFYDADAIAEPAAYSGPNGRQQSPHAQGFARRSRAEEVERQEKRRTVRPGVDTRGGGQGQGAMTFPAHSRNKRNVWTVPTRPFADAHFATFPPNLIEPCVLAGAPPRCCGQCGAPQDRIVERHETGHTQKMADSWDTAPGGHGTVHRDGRSKGEAGVPVMATRTAGARPTCEHDDDSGRAIVLDPFAGAGTTGMVALRHDRSFIGIELSAEYSALARDRIRDDAPLFNSAAEVAA